MQHLNLRMSCEYNIEGSDNVLIVWGGTILSESAENILQNIKSKSSHVAVENIDRLKSCKLIKYINRPGHVFSS